MPSASSTKSPLSSDQMHRLADASRRSRKVRRAAGVAKVSGAIMAFFAFVSLIAGLWSVAALAVGVGLGLAAINELRGGRMLQRFSAKGASVLMWNQALVALVIAGYCGWQIWIALTRPSSLELQLAEAGLQDPGIASAVQSVSVMAYGGIIVLTLLYQSLIAAYYGSRAQHVRGYLSTTEPWIVDVQRLALAA